MRNKVMRLIAAAVVIAAFGMSGCKPGVENVATKAVADLTREPKAAEFRKVTSLSDGTVCGEVNGKNAYGGFSGFERFIYSAGGSPITIESTYDDAPAFDRMWKLTCASDELSDAERATLLAENNRAEAEADAIEAQADNLEAMADDAAEQAVNAALNTSR